MAAVGLAWHPAPVAPEASRPKTPTCSQTQSNITPYKPGNWILPTYGNTDCWKDYDVGPILGKGTFGTTYLTTRKGTTEKYAVKVGLWWCYGGGWQSHGGGGEAS